MRIGDRKKEIERDIVTALYLSKKNKKLQYDTISEGEVHC